MHMQWESLANEHILGIAPYEPGKPVEEVEHFMARVPERTIVVFDEAYIEFAMGPDFPDALSYVRQGRKAIVLRTFSKASSLAGLRVGYAVADADAIALMNRIRQPFNVNALAQVAALAALE